MSHETNQSMHHEHLEWSNDCKMWRDDIRAWQHELETARAIVGRISGALQAHETMLQRHAAVIRLNEQLPAAHEHVLQRQEQGTCGCGILPTGEQHFREASKHAELKHVHEQTKRNHHAIMAEWKRLLRLLQRDDLSILQPERIAS